MVIDVDRVGMDIILQKNCLGQKAPILLPLFGYCMVDCRGKTISHLDEVIFCLKESSGVDAHPIQVQANDFYHCPK